MRKLVPSVTTILAILNDFLELLGQETLDCRSWLIDRVLNFHKKLVGGVYASLEANRVEGLFEIFGLRGVSRG